MKKFFIFALVLFSFLPIMTVFSSNDLASRLSGRILLQVEENGEAWYVNPDDFDIYYLGRPDDAFNLMKESGLGISNQDLNKISIGVSDFVQNDSDEDGLDDNFETVIGTDTNNNDSDNDGYDDKSEILSNFNPNGSGEIDIDEELGERLAGRIILQVEENGEAWYVNPSDLKRYYLGRPSDAFNLMRLLGLGISNQDLAELSSFAEATEDTSSFAEATEDTSSFVESTEDTSSFVESTEDTSSFVESTEDTSSFVEIEEESGSYSGSSSPTQVKSAVVSSIRGGNTSKLKGYFTDEKKEAVEYTMDFLDGEGEDAWADLIAESRLIESGEDEYIYQSIIDFAGSEVEVNFTIIKQDGQWLFDSL